MRRESPAWWFWMTLCAGAILPLLTGIVVWVVLQAQGKPVLSVSTILGSIGVWILLSGLLAAAAAPTAFLIRVLVKERTGAWVRGAAWGMFLGLSAILIALFGSLWRNAGSAIEVVVLAPVYFLVMNTIGALMGGAIGALVARSVHALRARRGDRETE